MTVTSGRNAMVAIGFLLGASCLAAPPTDPKRSDDSSTIAALLDAHNRERAAVKLSPLTLEPRLTAAAKAHSNDMAAHRKMTHDGSDGSTPSVRIKRQNYHYMNDAENVAEGYRTVKDLMRGWMESEHHRENILGPYTQVGFALARDDDGRPYWTADFGTPWPSLDPAEAADELVRAINKARAKADLPPLNANRALARAAAEVIKPFAEAESFELKKPGDDLVTIVRRVGYRYRELAESAASGQPKADDVLATWMDNPTHRSQILGKFTEVGVAYKASPTEKPYWCLILARPLTD